MNRPINVVITSLILLGTGTLSGTVASAQQTPEVPRLEPGNATTSAKISTTDVANKLSAVPVTGQGKMRFKVFLTSERLPEEAKKALRSAHGLSLIHI